MKKYGALLAVFCIGLIVSFFSFHFICRQKTEETVCYHYRFPHVIGWNIQDAYKHGIQYQYKIEIVAEEYSLEHLAGEILRQKPKAHTTYTPGDTLDVTLSKGIEEIQVPLLYGLSETKALTLLHEKGLTFSHISKMFHQHIPQGKIIATNPPAGQTVSQNKTVDLLISMGPSSHESTNENLSP